MSKGYITTGHININEFEKQFKIEMTFNLHKVVKAWLMAATGRVPIWSGMAMGSLLEVSETVNGGLIVTPRSGIKSRISLGRSLGSADAKYGPDVYSMIIKSSVPHYVSQDVTNVGVSKSAPWMSFPAGMMAAGRAASNISVNGPKIKTKRITS